jgi:hypothetical protein
MWEDAIKVALERGYFRTEEYTLSFYEKAEYLGSIDVHSIACFGGWLQFSTKIEPVIGLNGRTYDAVRIFREGLPELMQEVKDGALKDGTTIHVRFTRPIKE